MKLRYICTKLYDGISYIILGKGKGGGRDGELRKFSYCVSRNETEQFGVAVFCGYPVTVPGGALSIMSNVYRSLRQSRLPVAGIVP